jgi:hypothetical protein
VLLGVVPDQQQRRLSVDGEGQVELFSGQLEQRLVGGPGVVGDEDVERTD